ncbi:MAG: 50S ribosome-binding GTPase [Erysipelotrichaceae bacterium]|nr:50S ribosome-binding GTPase [Erysipelotrichaceae bacterium]
MKKCKGCGTILQTEFPEKNGYIKDISQEYCQRCFRLIHYDDVVHFKADHLNNNFILDLFHRYEKDLFVVIIDILDIFCLPQDDIMEYFMDYDVVLIINKTDILPENIRDEKLESIFTKQIKKLRKTYPRIKAAIMTNRFENAFNEKLYEVINELKERKIVFAGRTNAGKSTLINKLLHEGRLTTSIYPGTTLDETVIEHDVYTFIDTPGLLDGENYTTYLDLKMNKKLKISKPIRPQIFQFNSRQSYFLEGLLRVDVDPKDQASIIFYVSNDLKIHRSPYEKADQYVRNNVNGFELKAPIEKKETIEIKKKQLFVIKGVGMFKVTGNCRINVHVHRNVAVYGSEVEI